MSFSVKKLIFYGFLSVFLAFSLSTCVESPENIGETTYTNVEYSADGKSLTIYLDGSAPVKADRALSRRLALLGHDFFEVTFLYNDVGTYRIAKASWELGEPAGVSDVYRTETGVDYYIPANPLGLPATGLPASGGGLAVLFVGRKSDKSLLAVGALSSIDGVSVTDATNPLVKTTTKKVSFAVNAFTAGVNTSYASTDNSFKITSPSTPPQDDPLKSIIIGGKNFPYYHLPVSATATATYTIGVYSTTPPYNVFSFYAPAIRYGYGDNIAECWNIKPYYTLPPNIEKSDTEYSHNSAIRFSITNYTTNLGESFGGAVNFNITTTAANRVICALTFRIPVYAVTETPESVQWYIKPGYNMYYEELDSGARENGGAVLIGVGDIDGDTSNGLLIIGEPIKYNNINPPTTLNFSLQGIEIYYKTGSSLTNLTSGANYPNYLGWTGLTFFWDDNGNDIADAPMTSDPFTFPAVNRTIKIMVVYTVGSNTYTAIFYVEVNNISSAINIPYENRFIIAKKEDYSQAMNKISSGNYLFVFSENVNLPDKAINLTGSVSIYMVATVPNLTIGRQGGTDNTTFNGFTVGRTVNIYLGKWPFNSPAFAAGDVITFESFRISSRATWENYGATGGATTRMFVRGTGTGGTMTIDVLSGAVINYPAYIGP